jgi:Mitochondrial carrier protein
VAASIMCQSAMPLHMPKWVAALLQGPVNCAATIVREEGLRGLWSGASPTVLRNGTNQMCLFWAKNHMDSVLWSEWLSLVLRQGVSLLPLLVGCMRRIYQPNAVLSSAAMSVGSELFVVRETDGSSHTQASTTAMASSWRRGSPWCQAAPQQSWARLSQTPLTS